MVVKTQNPLVQAKPALSATYHPQNPVLRAPTVITCSLRRGIRFDSSLAVEIHFRGGASAVRSSRPASMFLTAHDRRLVVTGQRGANHVLPRRFQPPTFSHNHAPLPLYSFPFDSVFVDGFALPLQLFHLYFT